MKRLIPLMLAVAVSACSDPSAPVSSLEGEYVLIAQQGRQLPAPLNDGSQAPIITAGSLVINEDGSFVLRRFYRVSADSSEIREDITSRGVITMHPDGQIWFNFSGFEFSAVAERSGDTILLMGGEWYRGLLAHSMSG